MLELRLFGGFQAFVAEEPAPAIPTHAGRLLVARLALENERPFRRAQLAGWLWPDLDEAKARRRLSHTLWQVQDVLGEATDTTYLDISGEQIGFAAHRWIDVEEFESTLSSLLASATTHPLSRQTDREPLEHAISLYRGDFLAGYYDDWVDAEQDRLAQMHLRALGQMVRLAKSHQDWEGALTYARRLTNHDPLREDAHREVMRLSVLLGRPSEALTQFERCRSVLQDELGTEPAEATRRLHQQILRQRDLAPAADTDRDVPAGALPFVGREQERSRIVEQLERALAGRGGSLLVEGDPGVGKTRLLQEATDAARWRGFVTLWGSAEPRDTPRPFGLIREALRSELTPLRVQQLAARLDPVWRDEAAQVLPQLAAGRKGPRTLEAAEGAERLQESLVEVVLALADVDPIVLVAEDLHWADSESLAVLVRLAGRLRDRSIELILTFRPQETRDRAETWEAVRSLDRIGSPVRLDLPPLTPFGIAELIRSSLGSSTAPRGLAQRLATETGGNPLFVIETLRILQHEGYDEEHATDLPLASSIDEVITQRLGMLRPEQRQVLGAAAVLGSDLLLDTLTEITDQAPAETADALQALVRRGLLTEHDDSVSFSHDQIRRVTYDRLTPSARTRLHARSGEVLERFSPDAVEVLAHHFHEGDRPRQALRYLHRAAERARTLHAYSTAERHLARAARLLARVPASVAERRALLGLREEVLGVLGDRETQAEVLEALTGLTAEDPGQRSDVARRWARLHAHRARFDQAIASARRSLDLAPDRVSRGRALTTLGSTLTWAGRREEAVGALESAVELFDEDLPRRAEALAALGILLRELQRYDEALAALQAGADLAEKLEDPRRQAQIDAALGAVLMETGRSHEALTAYERAVDTARRLQFRHGLGVGLVNLGNVLYFLGRPGSALQAYDEAGEVFAIVGDQRGDAITRMNAANLRYRLLADDRAIGDLELALSYFRDAEDSLFEALTLDNLAEVRRRQGDLVTARRVLDDGLRALETEPSSWAEAQLRTSRAVVVLEQGNAAEALADARAAGALAEEADTPELLPPARSVEALAVLAHDRSEDAVALARTATRHVVPGVERSFLVHHRLATILERSGAPPADVAEPAGAAATELLRVLDDVTASQRDHALKAVPEHAAILERWERLRPRRRELALTRKDVPTGRPVRDEDRIDVTVTVTRPEEHELSPIEQRRSRIERVIREADDQGAVWTVVELADLLDVSVATVRRDLRAIRERGTEAATRGHSA